MCKILSLLALRSRWSLQKVNACSEICQTLPWPGPFIFQKATSPSHIPLSLSPAKVWKVFSCEKVSLSPWTTFDNVQAWSYLIGVEWASFPVLLRHTQSGQPLPQQNINKKRHQHNLHKLLTTLFIAKQTPIKGKVGCERYRISRAAPQYVA